MPDDASRGSEPATGARPERLPLGAALGFMGGVPLPTLAKGPILRRPCVVALAERLDLDARAVRRVARLHDRHGPGPVVVAVPGRPQAVLLAPDHVRRVLAEGPEPFAPASREKRSALAHFEPDVSLVSTGAERARRKRLNDAALEAGRATHSLAGALTPRIEAEATALAEPGGTLDWPRFAAVWSRLGPARRAGLRRDRGRRPERGADPAARRGELRVPPSRHA
jgi:hypothetical protein